ncbi:MAG: hypothetical protein E7185_11875 [Erysipelotrichaceae bacterium]|nr:hypothetical protein [Erysipelotrichaceae bacterium]
MKKVFASVLTLAVLLAAGCGAKQEEKPADTTDQTADVEKSEGVMTYADFMAAEMGEEVTVEAFVQGKQSWWQDTATVYAQDKDGGYLFYNLSCSEDDFKKLTDGQLIKVTGTKTQWPEGTGVIEIADGTFELGNGSWVAPATDVTSFLGTDDLVKYMNMKVSFAGLTVEDKGDGAAFYYNWDNSGTEGDDLYFDASLNGKKYTFTVESYLTDSNSEVYNAVENLKVGDVIDMEGFLYWYEGMNPHITSVTVK